MLRQTEYHFTGKERDSESGNDYFMARYYSSAMGRFLSPDWSAKEEPVPYAKLDDPQTLNLYSYMRNNSLAGVDADGHDALWVKDKATGQVTLVIPVHFTGSGATQERIQQIVDRDNSLNTNGSPVKIQVISTDKPMNGVLNTLDVSPGPNARMCGDAGSYVNTLGGNKGHIDSNDTGINDSGPHEDLHFAGIKDGYVEGPKDANGNRTAVPAVGYDNSNIYGPVGTPLRLNGINFGPSGTVIFQGYANGVAVGSPVSAVVSSWTDTTLFLAVPQALLLVW